MTPAPPLLNRLTARACDGAIAALSVAVRGRIRTGLPWPLGPWLRAEIMWRRQKLLYRGRADDIFVVSFPKSGTTLMQMLIYQLLTDGGMEIGHIGEFSPWLERDLAHDATGAMLDALPSPRVLKSHLAYRQIPRGPGRYIYVMRNGLDVAASLYHQLQRIGYDVPFDRYVLQFLHPAPGGVNWFAHVADWLRNPAGLNTLYVSYEDLVRDLPASARRVAEFCGISPGQVDWPRVLERCSFAFMRAHEAKLDGTSGPLLMPIDEADGRLLRCGQIGQWRSMVDADLQTRFLHLFDHTVAHLPAAAALRDHVRAS